MNASTGPTSAIRHAIQFAVSSTGCHDEYEYGRESELSATALKHDHAIFDTAVELWAHPWQKGSPRKLDGRPERLQRKLERFDYGHLRPIYELIGDQLAVICRFDP